MPLPSRSAASKSTFSAIWPVGESEVSTNALITFECSPMIFARSSLSSCSPMMFLSPRTAGAQRAVADDLAAHHHGLAES